MLVWHVEILGFVDLLKEAFSMPAFYTKFVWEFKCGLSESIGGNYLGAGCLVVSPSSADFLDGFYPDSVFS